MGRSKLASSGDAAMSFNTFNVEYLTSKEVAKILRCKPETVQGYIRSGALAGTKIGRAWLTTRVAIADFLVRKNRAP
ncbi:MAG: Helix-turn-helix domain [Cyanobacteria bacterium RYN_339]|nr:Helix-turn-helix domain [Cyanobacteria bacterium RYN_339]